MGYTKEVPHYPGSDLAVQVFDDGANNKLLSVGNSGLFIVFGLEGAQSMFRPDDSYLYDKKEAPVRAVILLGALSSLRGYMNPNMSQADGITPDRLSHITAYCNTQMARFAERLGIVLDTKSSQSENYDFDVTVDLNRICALPDGDRLVQKTKWAAGILRK